MAYRPYEAGEMSAEEPTSELASPWIRLVAWLIDGLIYFVITVAVIIGIALAGNWPGRSSQTWTAFFLGALAVVIGLIALALLSYSSSS